ncbi:hypothetical protein CFP56_034775 [Quercus suber]|uniref:Uncharacterized protein n=1 Tax=Quercus suber TaxID=58331 RepID=A0AAW0LRW9_QUESU
MWTPPWRLHFQPPSPEEAIQIEQISAEDIELVEGLQRSRRPPAHAPIAGPIMSTYMVETKRPLSRKLEVYADQWHNQLLCSKSFIRVSTMLGTMTIRGFDEEDRFFAKHLELIDRNANSSLTISYGLTINTSLVFPIHNQCTLANYVISVSHGAIQFTAYAELRKGMIDSLKYKDRKMDSESDA